MFFFCKFGLIFKIKTIFYHFFNIIFQDENKTLTKWGSEILILIWRIPFLNELISAKNNKIVINGVDQAELDDIINFICTT